MADDVPLAFYLPAGLFLKPDAKICIDVKLPEIKVSGVSISNWEVMEKIKILVLPEVFTNLRVVHYSRDVINFKGEFESMRAMRKVVLLLHGKVIKLSGFADFLRLKAWPYQPPYPTEKEWEEFFSERGVESFEDGKPGERPDTIHVRGLPVKWFTSRTSEGKPCPRILTQAFQKFGPVRQVGIVEQESNQSQSSKFSSFGPGSGSFHFDGYVQYDKYSSFTNAMSGLKGMKILRLEDGGREAVALIGVDFDRGGFLSDRNIRKRRRVEERQRIEREEQERREEEERRKKELKEAARRQEEEEAKATKRARKLEEKRKRKQQRALLVAHLKAIAVRRRQEAQRLLSVLLAGAAEARYV